MWKINIQFISSVLVLIEHFEKLIWGNHLTQEEIETKYFELLFSPTSSSIFEDILHFEYLHKQYSITKQKN